MQRRSHETRARILDAAQTTFSKNGYDATGVAEICEAAGVSKGAFYHHFPTKHAVFMALLEGWLSGLDKAINLIRQEKQDVPQTLIQMAGMVKQIFQSASGKLSIFFEFWSQASRDPVVWQTTIAPYRRYQAYFSTLMQEGIAEGSIKAVDAEMASRVILSLAVGILLQGFLDPQGANWEDVAQLSMRYLMDGIARDEPLTAMRMS
jgi:AcrR family transcriptional regulator